MRLSIPLKSGRMKFYRAIWRIKNPKFLKNLIKTEDLQELVPQDSLIA
jgi:hypothetical protein